jgi:hypothetical protein
MCACMNACMSVSVPLRSRSDTLTHTSTFLAIPLQQRSAGLLTHPLLERGLLLDYRMSELHGSELARPAPVCATPRPRVRPPRRKSTHLRGPRNALEVAQVGGVGHIGQHVAVVVCSAFELQRFCPLDEDMQHR